MQPCLTLSIIRYGSRVKWSNPGNGVAPSPTTRCSSYWKRSLRITLDYGWQLHIFLSAKCYFVHSSIEAWISLWIAVSFKMLITVFHFLKRSIKSSWTKKTQQFQMGWVIFYVQIQHLWQISSVHSFLNRSINIIIDSRNNKTQIRILHSFLNRSINIIMDSH